MNSLEVGKYDPVSDTIEIEGVRYAGHLFREFGLKGMTGQVLRIDSKFDGVLTVTRLVDREGTKTEGSDYA